MDFRSVFVALLGVSVAGASAYGAREYMNNQTATAVNFHADVSRVFHREVSHL